MAPQAAQLEYSLPEVYNRQGQRLPNMFELPSDDPEEPGLPDYFHYLQPPLLSQTCHTGGPCFSCGDMQIYFDENHPLYYKRADWFVALVPPTYYGFKRESFLVWQEKAVPFLVVELLSFGTRKQDLFKTERKPGKPPCKLEVYEDILQIPYYVVHDEEGCDFIAWHWEDGGYREMVKHNGRIALPEIGLELGIWAGVIEDANANGVSGNWLRFFKEGKMIPTHEEKAAMEKTAKEWERAEKERERAEKERERAEKEQAHAALERERAEKERLLALLKKAGVDPEG